MRVLQEVESVNRTYEQAGTGPRRTREGCALRDALVDEKAGKFDAGCQMPRVKLLQIIAAKA